MIQSMNQVCQNYYDNLPSDTIKIAAKSALFSFITSVCIVAITTKPNQPVDLARSALAATIAATATIIHALTQPIFNYLFDQKLNSSDSYVEFIRVLYDIIFTHVLVNNLTAFKINLINTIIPSGENFVILPSNLIRISLDLGVKCVSAAIDPALANQIGVFFTNNGIDLNFTNSTPTYITI